MRSPIRAFAIALLGGALLSGCGGGIVIGGFDCDAEIAALRASRGAPDTIDRSIEAGLYIETFWYAGAGLTVTFTWAGDVPCRRRDATFSPVP